MYRASSLGVEQFQVPLQGHFLQAVYSRLEREFFSYSGGMNAGQAMAVQDATRTVTHQTFGTDHTPE